MEKENKHFYRQMLAIAIPVSLQSLLTSFLNTLDTIMISSLGDASIAGVGLANQVFFLFTLISHWFCSAFLTILGNSKYE